MIPDLVCTQISGGGGGNSSCWPRTQGIPSEVDILVDASTHMVVVLVVVVVVIVLVTT